MRSNPSSMILRLANVGHQKWYRTKAPPARVFVLPLKSMVMLWFQIFSPSYVNPAGKSHFGTKRTDGSSIVLSVSSKLDSFLFRTPVTLPHLLFPYQADWAFYVYRVLLSHIRAGVQRSPGPVYTHHIRRYSLFSTFIVLQFSICLVGFFFACWCESPRFKRRASKCIPDVILHLDDVYWEKSSSTAETFIADLLSFALWAVIFRVHKPPLPRGELPVSLWPFLSLRIRVVGIKGLFWRICCLGFYYQSKYPERSRMLPRR